MRLLTPAHRLAATIAALACAALTGAAFAQSPNVVELQRDPGVRAAIGSCMADRGRLCSGVAPGSGRIARCLAARSEALSPACRIAMEKASSVRRRRRAHSGAPRQVSHLQRGECPCPRYRRS